MNEISRKQAELIVDIDSYKEVTGAKRFKRTKDEMDRRLSPSEALQERLAAFGSGPKNNQKDDREHGVQDRRQITNKGSRTSQKGNIVIRIRPEVGVDADYFEKLIGQDVEILLDEKWYSWLDNKLECPYDGDIAKLLKHILNMGIGEVLTRIHFSSDLEKCDE